MPADHNPDEIWYGGPGTRAIRTRIIRGGSSKGIFLRASDLKGKNIDTTVLRLFGSPDPRQIDGLGGADKLTSKLAVMSPPTRDDCDIDYYFGQVSIRLPEIDWESNCGNLAAGAALFCAFDSYGKAKVDGGYQRIAIHQRNTGRRIIAKMPMLAGHPQTQGDYAIGGVPGTGACISLDFADFAGSCLGGPLLPLAQPRSKIVLPDDVSVELSILDMANLHVFVSPATAKINMDAPLSKLQADRELIERLEDIRLAAAVASGFCDGSDARKYLQVSMNPLLHVVAPPCMYRALNDTQIASERMDLRAISFSRGAFSQAFPASGAVAMGVASLIPETLVHKAAHCTRSGELRIGHPSGLLTVTSELGSGGVVRRAEIGRTARLIMDGMAFV